MFKYFFQFYELKITPKTLRNVQNIKNEQPIINKKNGFNKFSFKHYTIKIKLCILTEINNEINLKT